MYPVCYFVLPEEKDPSIETHLFRKDMIDMTRQDSSKLSGNAGFFQKMSSIPLLKFHIDQHSRITVYTGNDSGFGFWKLRGPAYLKTASSTNHQNQFSTGCLKKYRLSPLAFIQFFGVRTDPRWMEEGACIEMTFDRNRYRGPHWPRISTCASIFFTTGWGLITHFYFDWLFD